ncbi:MAG: protein kinase [Acidobacteria bacterium]|nr:protein kinase [Acidobacteriota bacterium]
MTLTPGTRLGPYEIVGPLGAGGMGEVYRARDTRLDRAVAIKVLPAHLSSNAGLKARFEREARAVSSLNHPNICTLHDIGREGETDFLVMELLEGETLAARLERGAIPTGELIRMGVEIAAGLDRAHRAGIIHRDLKPGNIMLTKSGAKLLDFGVARSLAASSPSGAGLTAAPTMHSPLTAEGSIVGTFQYMAPEQFEGKEADARSDIFAFGSVVYEAATGVRVFEGKTQATLIAAILKEEPKAPMELQPMIPPALDRLIRTCLAKDPEERRQTVHDVLLELKWIAESGSKAGVAMPGDVTTAPIAIPRRASVLPWLLVLTLGATLAAVAVTVMRTKPAAAEAVRLGIPAPEGAIFNLSGDVGGPPVLSADGKLLAFSAIAKDSRSHLFVRPLDSLEARIIPGTEGANFPFWSPDGRSLGYFADEKLKRVDVATGTSFTLCDTNQARGGTWLADGTILFAPSFQSAIHRIPAGGGKPVPVTTMDASKHTTHRWPQALPDGRHFLYMAASHKTGPAPDTGIYFGSVDGGEEKFLVKTLANGIYGAGYLLYVQDDTLVAQPLDPVTGKLTGEPVPTSEKVRIDTTTWKSNTTVAGNGVLVYEAAGTSGGSFVRWMERAGKPGEPITPSGVVLNTRLSPDGRSLAVEAGGPTADIWVYELQRNTKTRLTLDTADDGTPIWSHDGSRIFFASSRSGKRYEIYEKAADGSGDERLVLSMDTDVWPADASPDGRYLAFVKGVYANRTGTDIYALPLTGEKKPFLVVGGPSSDGEGAFSPDGRYFAYSSDESGRQEIYIKPFPPPASGGGRWQVSTSGGMLPRWRRDGKEIYYRKNDNSTIAGVAVEPRGGSLVTGQESDLFLAFQTWGSNSYDVAPDGQRFVVLTFGSDVSKPLAVVLNWTAALK